MSSCDALHFGNIDGDAWNCIVNKAAEHGIKITGNSGSASEKGVTVEYNYNPSAQTLMLRCTGKPFFVACSTINDGLNELVSGCR